MQYVANTPQDKSEILKAIGVSRFEDLLVDIPQELRIQGIQTASGISEMELLSALKKKGQKNSHSDRFACFLGAGVYDHYIPPLVNHLATRGEFITAYTPYQGEASQGTLQTIYEYQTMICLLTQMDVANASMYDGASGAAEAVLMALRIAPKKKILISENLHPESLETIQTHISNLDVEIVQIPHRKGLLDLNFLKEHLSDEVAAVVFQTPNFLGYLEDGEKITQLTHQHKALSIVSVNPLSLSLVKPPGAYSADIVVGEGQPLGNAISYGGPHFGFFAVKSDFVRRLPGRIAGMTKDKDGENAFVLTLQAREQHIRREKATSNICTNHALCALKGLIFLSVLGPKGFRRMGELNVQNSHQAYQMLKTLREVESFSDAPFFNEFTIKINKDQEALRKSFEASKLIGPLHLGRFGEKWKQHYLVAVTEQRSTEEVERLVKAIQEA